MMNAFLTVKVLKYDVQSMQDVLDKGYKVMTYLDSSEEDIFKNSQFNTHTKKSYCLAT